MRMTIAKRSRVGTCGELSELVPVAQVDLIAIDLNFDTHIECDERGNCGCERSAFEFRDAAGTVRSGEIVDVYLACQRGRNSTH